MLKKDVFELAVYVEGMLLFCVVDSNHTDVRLICVIQFDLIVDWLI